MPLVTQHTLHTQNQHFQGTGAVSQECRAQNFLPGFLDHHSGLIYPSRFANGQAAPIHVLDGLPEHLVVERSVSGRVLAVQAQVEAGFIRNGEFFTRAQVAQLQG